MNKAPTAPSVARGSPTRIVYKSRGLVEGGTSGSLGGFRPPLCVGVYHDAYADIYGCA